MTRVREQRVGAGDVFFGLHRVNFIFDFVVLASDSDDAGTVQGTGGGAQGGETKAQVVPGEIKDVGNGSDSERSEKGATQ